MDVVLLGIPIGIVMLYFGSEWLVKGAKSLALKLKVAPFVVGLTVVAFGSSAPEMVTSIVSSNNPSIILGNVIGSNIANIGVAIGLAALICPMVAKYDSMRIEITTMVVISFVMLLMMVIDGVTFVEGIVLFVILFSFIFMVYRMKKGDEEGQKSYVAELDEGEVRNKWNSYPVLIALIIIGLVLLYFGARFFIDGSVRLALMFDVSEFVIGLLVVALGTSLPEICICLVAAKRGENELAVSNIVGSNIFNICAVLGIGAMLTTIPYTDAVMYFHMPVMIFLSVLMFLMVKRKNMISRRSAALLLGVYVAYVAVLFLVPSLSM